MVSAARKWCMPRVKNPLKPFDGCRVYAPILHKKMGRRMAVVIFPDGSRTTFSYAKYLMSVCLGRILSREEEVDHVDGDRLNDSLDNLQVLTRGQNRAKRAVDNPAVKVTYLCARCGKEKTVRKGADHGLVKRGYAYCSRACARKFQV
jgi:hypothetical protein